MRRFGVTFLLACSAWLALAPSAAAHTVRFESRLYFYERVTTGGNVVHLGGYVKSRKDACEAGRYVEVYAGDTFYGADPSTDVADGRWDIDGSMPDGQTYRAKVLKSALPTTPGHHHVCDRDTYREAL